MEARIAELWKKIEKNNWNKKLARLVLRSDKELYVREWELNLISSIKDEKKLKIYKSYLRHQSIKELLRSIRNLFISL